jgi:hypothetical protein
MGGFSIKTGILEESASDAVPPFGQILALGDNAAGFRQSGRDSPFHSEGDQHRLDHDLRTLLCAWDRLDTLTNRAAALTTKHLVFLHHHAKDMSCVIPAHSSFLLRVPQLRVLDSNRLRPHKDDPTQKCQVHG